MTAVKTLIAAAALLAVCGFAFVYSGMYNVAADKPHTPLVERTLETLRERSVARHSEAIAVPPDLANPERISHGAQLYASMCQACHLGPGIEQTPLHAGLMPAPPRLAEHATQQAPEQLYWIVKHGIKMTGMPAWGQTQSERELWDVVAFLQKLPHLGPQEYRAVTQQTSLAHSH